MPPARLTPYSLATYAQSASLTLKLTLPCLGVMMLSLNGGQARGVYVGLILVSPERTTITCLPVVYVYLTTLDT